MDSDKVVSIIVPVFNVEKYLYKCINSIVNQTYKNLDIIIVDDGSTDNSAQLCDEIVKTDNRIRVFHKNNGGLSDARNCGLEHAIGDYYYFIDSDDYIAPNTIEYAINNIGESEIFIFNYEKVYEKDFIIYDDSNSIEIWDKNTFWTNYYNSKKIYCVVAWNKLFKKNLFLNDRFDYGKIHEDEFILHRLINRVNKITVSNKKLYFYLQRSGSIMGKVSFKKVINKLEAFILRLQDFKHNNYQFIENSLSDVLTYLCICKNRISNSDEKYEFKKLYLNAKNIIRNIDYKGFSRKNKIRIRMFLHFRFIYFFKYRKL